MRNLITEPLTADRIDQAFPLVQASLPHVGLEDWRDFARDLVRGGPSDNSGIQSVITEQDYIAGLSIYRIESGLCHGPTLIADHFMALDLFDRAAVVNVLADFLEDLGRLRGCTAVHTHLPERAGRWRGPADCVAATLRARGHAIESLRLCKVLGEAATRRERALPGA